MSFAFTQEEILAEIERRENQQAEQPASNVESAAALVGGMPGRMRSAFEGRKQEVAEIVSDEDYKIPGHQMVDLIGKGVAGPVMDIVGEAITTGVGAAVEDRKSVV